MSGPEIALRAPWHSSTLLSPPSNASARGATSASTATAAFGVLPQVLPNTMVAPSTQMVTPLWGQGTFTHQQTGPYGSNFSSPPPPRGLLQRRPAHDGRGGGSASRARIFDGYDFRTIFGIGPSLESTVVRGSSLSRRIIERRCLLL